MDDNLNEEVSAWIHQLRSEHKLNTPFNATHVTTNEHISFLHTGAQEESAEFWRTRNGKGIADILDEEIRKNIHGLKKHVRDPDFLKALQETTIISFPTFETNALIGKLYGRHLVAMFHEGFFHAINSVCFWYGRTGESLALPLEFKARENTMNVIGPYLVALFSGLGAPLPEKIYPRTEAGLNVARKMVLTSVRFVIAHELSHIALGHEYKADDPDHNHRIEFEADQTAFLNCMNAELVTSKHNNYSLRFSFFAPFLAIGLLILINSKENSTHPEPIERMRRLATYMHKFLENSNHAKILGPNEFLPVLSPKDINNIVERIGHHANLMSYYSDGFSSMLEEFTRHDRKWSFPELFDLF